jgi:hypothetical protein
LKSERVVDVEQLLQSRLDFVQNKRDCLIDDQAVLGNVSSVELNHDPSITLINAVAFLRVSCLSLLAVQRVQLSIMHVVVVSALIVETQTNQADQYNITHYIIL